MYLLVGLGNPGPQYAGNRHNIGFMAIDEIARQHHFGPWRRKFQGEISEGQIGPNKVLLLKPTTFMNESGRAVSEACRFYKIAPQDVYVYHDELDLSPGKVKAKLGGGVAGHNGLRSTGAHIGNDFHRIRLGIGHPGRERVTQWVLGDFAKADREWLEPTLDALAYTASSLIENDLGRFMTDFNQRLAPPVNGHKKARSKSASADGAPSPSAKKAASGSADKQNGGAESARSAQAAEPPRNAMAEALKRLVTRDKDE